MQAQEGRCWFLTRLQRLAHCNVDSGRHGSIASIPPTPHACASVWVCVCKSLGEGSQPCVCMDLS